MSFLDRARALVVKLNTFTVGGIGLATALGSVLVVAAKGPAEAFLTLHAPVAEPYVSPWLEMAANTAMTALPPAIAAAYVGRPKGLSQSPKA